MVTSVGLFQHSAHGRLNVPKAASHVESCCEGKAPQTRHGNHHAPAQQQRTGPCQTNTAALTQGTSSKSQPELITSLGSLERISGWFGPPEAGGALTQPPVYHRLPKAFPIPQSSLSTSPPPDPGLVCAAAQLFSSSKLRSQILYLQPAQNQEPPQCSRDPALHFNRMALPQQLSPVPLEGCQQRRPGSQGATAKMGSSMLRRRRTFAWQEHWLSLSKMCFHVFIPRTLEMQCNFLKYKLVRCYHSCCVAEGA